tara:strand:- start:102 stop:542 length:441 start_codon:yes stop_codon:yes gene_type:complete
MSISFFSILKFQFESSTLKVRYCETDQMGFVHHSNYLKYFEAARLEWLDKLGISYKKMEEDGVLLPVIYTEIKYLFPLKFDDTFVVKVGINKIPLSRLVLNYQIDNHENKNICFGNVHLAFLNSKNHKPMRAPEKFTVVFKKNYEL